MRIHRPLSQVLIVVTTVALGGGCGALPSPSADDDATSVVASPLLGTPGAFYTQAPQHAFCSALAPASHIECHGGYSFNSAGAAPTATRLGTGVYRVTFPGVAHGGNVQIAAIATNAHCALTTNAAQAAGEIVEMVCRTPAGAQVDTGFTVSYYRDTNVGGSLGGYAHVRNTAPLSAIDTWSSSGGAITTTQLGVGAYRVTFAGQSFGGDTALVTAASTGATYCALAGWNAVAGGVGVDVRCFNFPGTATNADFSIFYSHNVRGEPRNTLPTGTQGGFAVITAPGSVDQTRSRNSCAQGANSAVIQLPSNLYTETFHAVTTFLGEVPLTSLVSAVGAIGSPGLYCNLNHLPVQGVRSDSRNFVSCFTPTGASIAAQHNSMFIIQDQSGC